jgi:DNA-binding response OmpR family regulator
MNLLYVEAEAKIADFVCSGLKEQGFVVEYGDNGDDGYARALKHESDRKKIDSLGGQGSIESIRGVGYRFRQVEN